MRVGLNVIPARLSVSFHLAVFKNLALSSITYSAKAYGRCVDPETTEPLTIQN